MCIARCFMLEHKLDNLKIIITNITIKLNIIIYLTLNIGIRRDICHLSLLMAPVTPVIGGLAALMNY